MKWIEYTMQSGLQAKVAVTGTVAETVASIREDMLDPLAFIVIDDGKELEPTETEVLQGRIEDMQRLDSAKVAAINQKLDFIEGCLIEIAQEAYK